MATVKSIVISELFFFGEQSKAFLKQKTEIVNDRHLQKYKKKCLFPIWLLTCTGYLHPTFH